jgi:methylglyoxal synthase
MASELNTIKNIALVAHDNRKQALLEWVRWNKDVLIRHQLIGTGTTGGLVEDLLNEELAKDGGQRIQLKKLKSGPLGGDQQLGSLIAEGAIDMLIFLWDPMQPQPHDVDIKALLRLSVLYNVPTACNRATADFLVSSHLMDSEYTPESTDYSSYLNRLVKDK